MQQWAVLVLPHASICDAPAFNYILTYLSSLSFTSHSLMWVHTYICQLVVVFLRHYLLLLNKSIRDDGNSLNVGRISMEIRNKKKKKKKCSDGWVV